MSVPPDAISARNISVRRGGRTVLESVSMSVAAGEIVMLLGPNGAGKSTLLATLAGDMRPDVGEIYLSGDSIGSFSKLEMAHRRAVYSATENSRLGYSARAIVEFGRRAVQASSKEDDAQAVFEAMRVTESTEFSNRVFGSLSEGERARVVLARVFAQETPILLLDEPTASLDIRHQHLVLQHLRALADKGYSVIAAIHDVNLACSYADRIGFLKNGRLVAIGEPAVVVTDALLEDVFGWPMAVFDHPMQAGPVVMPLLNPIGLAVSGDAK